MLHPIKILKSRQQHEVTFGTMICNVQFNSLLMPHKDQALLRTPQGSLGSPLDPGRTLQNIMDAAPYYSFILTEYEIRFAFVIAFGKTYVIIAYIANWLLAYCSVKAFSSRQ